MTSTTLPLQSTPSAQPVASTAPAARALAAAITEPAVRLRSALAAGLNAWRRAAHVRALRELAQAHQATDASYAADLLAAAERH